MDAPLINLDKLSEPLTKLIDVVAKGIGTIYSPWGTVRQAKADAKANIIHAKNEIDIIDIKERAQSRLGYQESQKQNNIERVVFHAANSLPDRVSNESIDTDWIFQFFDQAQGVCEEDMQILWGRILAGETSKPGSYSKRALYFLKTLDKWEAEAFSIYCSFLFNFDDGWKFVITTDGSIEMIKQRLNGIDPTSHFQHIGLLSPGETSFLPPSKIIGKKYITSTKST